MTSRPRVLILDDNLDTVAVLRDILSEEGYEIGSVADPKAAFRLLETSPADLILTDLNLPQIDGRTFPGHQYWVSRCMASGEISVTGRVFAAP